MQAWNQKPRQHEVWEEKTPTKRREVFEGRTAKMRASSDEPLRAGAPSAAVPVIREVGFPASVNQKAEVQVSQEMGLL